MATSTTRSKSARKNRTRTAAQEPDTTAVMVPLEAMQRIADLLKRLAYDEDPWYTCNELERAARESLEALRDGGRISRSWTWATAEDLLDATQKATGEPVTVDVRLVQRVSRILARLLGDDYTTPAYRLEDLCGDIITRERERRTLDAAVAAALAARATAPEAEIVCGGCRGSAHRVVEGAERYVTCTHGCGWRAPWVERIERSELAVATAAPAAAPCECATEAR